MIHDRIQLICQWLILVWIAWAFVHTLKVDVEGYPAKPPKGFPGIIATLIVIVFLLLILWNAGTFSRIL
jgi:hypothetical protein